MFRLIAILAWLSVMALPAAAGNDPCPQSGFSFSARSALLNTSRKADEAGLDPFSRRGRLWKDQTAESHLRVLLRPLDIILFRSRNHFFTRLIPGYFSHSAFYNGTEAELRRAGVWNDPNLAAHHAEVRGGAVFIEAANPEVQVSPYREILDTDAVAVFRPRLTKAERAFALRTLYEHLGTEFDHGFNASNDRKLFCAELIDHAMPALNLPRRIMFGRPVILPADIARLGLSGRSRLTFVTYVRGGKSGSVRRSAIELKSDMGR